MYHHHHPEQTCIRFKKKIKKKGGCLVIVLNVFYILQTVVNCDGYIVALSFRVLQTVA